MVGRAPAGPSPWPPAPPAGGPGRWQACPFKCRTLRKIKHSTVAQRSQTKSSPPVNVTLPKELGGVRKKRFLGGVGLVAVGLGGPPCVAKRRVRAYTPQPPP